MSTDAGDPRAAHTGEEKASRDGESDMAPKDQRMANEASESVPPASGPTSKPIDSIVADVAAELARLADPEIVDRAAALSELDAARLVQKLRAIHGARSKDVDAFTAKVKAARKKVVDDGESERQRRTPSWRDQLARTDRNEVAATFANLCVLLENLYAGRLAFDIMAQRPILDGEPLTDRMISKVRRRLSADEGVSFGKEDIIDAIGEVSSANEIHPVRDYLRACREKWDGKRRLDRVAKNLLNVQDKLSGVMVARTIKAAAARALYPGCQVDTILILIGHQGARKSTFFRILGGMWFGDSKIDITDRKGQMVMSASWVYEWPECDRMFMKHSDSDIKAFVTQRYDDFVPMFGRAVQRVHRSWLAVGTTNKPKFLTDVTGDRRTWPVDLRPNGPQWKVDARRVEAVRDQLMGEAVAEVEAFYEKQAQGVADHENPHRWFLNDAEEAERSTRTKNFRVENAWTETVGRWLAGHPVPCNVCKGSGERMGEPCATCAGSGEIKPGKLPKDPKSGREYVTTTMVLSKALGVPLDRHRQNDLAATNTLAELGWQSGDRIKVGGVKLTPYYPPEPDGDDDELEPEARDAEPVERQVVDETSEIERQQAAALAACEAERVRLDVRNE